MSSHAGADTEVNGSLRDAPAERLACLLRHWTWADEAMSAFDRELASVWDEDEAPMSDRPFGVLYHWCALLCALCEAALEQGLLSPLQLEPIRQDLEASLPTLKSSRDLLVVIPTSMEKQPRVADLIREEEPLRRLRHLHRVFGEALRQEQIAREIETLDQ